MEILAAIILVGIYSLKSVVMIIPAPLLYISAGVLFPPHWALIVTYLGLLCEFRLGYLIGKRSGREKIEKLMDKNKKLKQFLEMNENRGSISCFFTRLTPLPLDFASMFFGAIGVHYPVFIIFSLLGVTPKVIPFVLMGDAASNPLSKEFLVPFAISGTIVFCALAVYQRYQREEKDSVEGSKTY